MKVSPQRRAVTPKYPTREVLDAHRELLRACPVRWQRSAVLVAALTAFGGAGVLVARPAHADAPAVTVAPLFPHGDGEVRAVYGTTFSIEPVLIPEDEARQIIDEELKKAGIAITRERLPRHQLALSILDTDTKTTHEQRLTLEMDGRDAAKHVAYEYLSEADSKALLTTASLLDQAEAVRTALREAAPPDISAVFYDPGVRLGWYRGGGDKEPLLGTTPGTGNPDATLMPLGLFDGSHRGYGTTVTVKDNTATLTNDEKVVVLTVGSTKIVVNGVEQTLPAPVIRRGGVIYTPIRLVAEGLGYQVTTDAKKSTITLSGLEFICNEKMPEGRPPQKRTMMGTHTSEVVKIAGDPKSSTFAFIRWHHEYDIGGRVGVNRWDSDARKAFARAYASKELRLQVLDFIAWMKAQGLL